MPGNNWPPNGQPQYGNQWGNQPYGQPCGPNYYGGQGPQKPDNFLVWAILTTLFCCMLTGIVALYYSFKVDNCWNNGQYMKANVASQKAKLWVIISAVIGIVGSIAWFGVYMLLGSAMIFANL